MSIGIAALCGIGCATMILMVVSIIMYFVDKHRFNNGICKKCGGKLQYFDTDSESNDGYYCDKCNHIIWIGWYKHE